MKTKVFILFFLLSIIFLNLYLKITTPNIYTQSKTQFSSLKGSTSYLGRINLWQLLVQNNDWENASTLESELNSEQIKNYKLSYQPEELQNRINLYERNNKKTVDDYLELARIESILGLSNNAIESIKKAYQLDPIRSDVDKLFYSTNQ